MWQVCALRHQTGAQYSAVELTKYKAAERSSLVIAPHRDPTSRFYSETRADCFLRNASTWGRYVRILSSLILR